MKKKLIIWILIAVLTIGGATTGIILTLRDKEPSDEPEGEKIILTKENYEEYLTFESIVNGEGGSRLPQGMVDHTLGDPKLYINPGIRFTAAPIDDTHVFQEVSVTAKVYYIMVKYSPYENFDSVGMEDVQVKEVTLSIDSNGTGSQTVISHTFDTIRLTYVASAVAYSIESISGTVNIPCVHEWEDGETITPASCNGKGTMSENCTKCDKTREKTIDALGHDLPDEPNNTKPATCTEKGSEVYSCKRCNEYVTKTLEALGHSYNEEDATITPATCIEAGKVDYTCTECGENISEVIEALGHSFTNYTVTEATCTANSYKSAKCDRCDETDTVINENTALGHDYNANGKCNRCGITNPELKVSFLEISNETFLLEAGAATQIKYTVYPQNAIYEKVTYRIFQNNTCEATLTDAGVLTCAKVGSVTVAVTIDDEITARATFYVPQMITTAEEFFNIRNDLNGVYMLANDIDLSGYEKWTPIGNATKNSFGEYDYTNAFNGKFDGGGHTISGLNIDLSHSSANTLLTVGLFGSLSRDGQVSNVVLKDANVIGSSSATDYVGMLVGFNPGIVRDCTVNGEMTLSGTTYIGGAIGENIGSAQKISSDITITVTGDKNYFVGGITGRTTGGQLSNTTAVGTINVSGRGSVYVGGIAGNLVDKLTTASADVDITVKSTASSGYNYVGIIAGASSQSLSDITVDGSITVESYSNAYVGGIVGYSDTEISKCISNADLSVKITNSSSTASYVGGIIAYTSKAISDCTNNGALNVTQFYGGYVGGISGKSGSVTKCENNGEIYANSTYATFYCGGLVGCAQSVDACENNAKVNALVYAGSSNYVSGIAGYSNGSVSNCKNNKDGELVVGYSKSSSATSEKQYFGGLAGYVGGAVSASDNFANVSAYSDGVIYCGGAIGYAGGEVKNVNNYAYSLTVTSGATSSKSANYVGGVVGYISGALTDAYNTAQLTVSKGNVSLGGVAGSVNSAVNNVRSTANITVNSNFNNDDVYTYVGGVIGRAASSSANVNNSAATGSKITVNSKNRIYAGGVIGYGTVAVTECYAYPNITVSNSYITYVGGVSGYVSKIVKSYSTSGITANTLGNYNLYAGGLAGCILSSAEESYATGDISGTSSSVVYMAGLIGYVQNGATVKNCYASHGYIKTNSSTFSASNEVFIYNGGLVGYNGGSIFNCYSVSYNYSISYGFTNKHSHYIGGLVAYNKGTVSGSYVLDAVYKLARAGLEINRDVVGSGTADKFYAGGFVGYNNGSITDCYSNATVNTTVSGAYTGGFVGYNASTVKNAISYGEVNSGIPGDTTGGFAGGGSSGYTSCFFSKIGSLQTNSVGSASQSGITASENSALTSASTFGSFSSTYWNIVDGSYPTLIFGDVWESRSDSLNTYDMLLNVPNEETQYLFPHGNRVSVQFDTSEKIEIDTVIVNKGDTVVLPTPSDYTEDGVKYIFIGWCTDKERKNLVSQDRVTLENSITYYAYYTALTAYPTATEFTYSKETVSVAEIYVSCDAYTVAGCFEAENAGEYSLLFKLNHGYCWSDGSTEDFELTWRINPQKVQIPDIFDLGEFIFYTGTEINIYESLEKDLYTADGNVVISAMVDSKQSIKFTLKDGANYTWSDESTEAKSFDYYIATGACNSSASTVVYRLEGTALTILGSGAMASYSSGRAPWNSVAADITSVTIGAEITSIGTYAFNGCFSLTSVTIPDSVTSIGEGAFESCKSLTSVTIPDSVTSIGLHAFYNCISLTIYCEAESKPSGWNIYWNYSGCPIVWNCNNNDVANGGYIYTVADGVRYALKDGKATVVRQPQNITTANIPSTISYKGSNYNVTSIGDSAFYNCTSLTRINFSDSVETIGYSAFYGCSNLSEITLGNSLSSINSSAFYGCANLESVNITDIDKWCVISFGNISANPLSYAKNLYLNGDLVTELVVDNVESIRAYAFYNCTSLTSIDISDRVEIIENYAFYGCSNLSEITLEESLSSIGSYAFYGCTTLTSVVIPDSVTSIGSSTFSGCSSLESITLPFVGATKDATVASSSTLFGYIFGTSSYDGGTRTEQYYSTGSDNYARYYIPATLKSATITGGNILYGAFYNCSALTSVTIGNNVTSIGSYALYNCTSLTNIDIPNSVTTIGYYAFSNCTSLENVTFDNDSNLASIGSNAFYYCTSLTSVTIGNNVTTIGNGAFSNCTSLTSVTIGNNVTTIGGVAFSNCTSLTSVDIPNSVTSIGLSAFSNCTSLTSVDIPNSVTSIDLSAFSNCTSLESVNITDIDKWCVISFGNAYANPLYYAKNLYLNGDLVTELVIDNVESIRAYAFCNCTSLTNIDILDSVTSIGSSAFSGCSSLESITLPFVGGSKDATVASSSTLFGYIFGTSSYDGGTNAAQRYNSYSSSTSYCIPASLKTVTITGGNIFSGAFSNCTSLESVTISDSIEKIGAGAFLGCSSLQCITLPFIGESKDDTSNTSYGYYFGYIFLMNVYSNPNPNVPSSLKTVVITGGESINSSAFYNCTSLTNIDIPNSVTSIGSSAFYYCTSLTNIDIPNSVTSIGSSAFYNCTSLTSVTIGNNVTTIGDGAFSNCTSLAEIKFNATAMSDFSSSSRVFNSAGKNGEGINVTIGKNVTKIPAYLFNSSSSIVSLEFEEGSVCESIGDCVFYYCTSLTSVSIPNSVTNIGSSAFSNSRSLTSVTIPDSVTSIGDAAFYYCTSLTSVTIGNNVTTIGSSAFSNCTSLTEIKFNATAMSDLSSSSFVFNSAGKNGEGINVTIGKNVTRIPVYLFDGSDSSNSPKIVSLEFEEGSVCESIGDCAFSDCTSLANIDIPDSVETIGDYAFSRCTSLTSVDIPNSVTSIGSSAFYNCTSLESVTFDNDSNLASIGSYAFSGCTSLESVTFDNDSKLTSIGAYAFYNCTSLTSVDIPNSVTTIDFCTFSDCTSLESVTFDNDSKLTSIGSSAFYNCTSLTNIDIPNSVTSIGSYAFYNCISLTNIDIPDSVKTIGNYAFSGCTSLTRVTFEDTSTWYRTTSPSNWENKTGGTSTSVTNSSSNATYFKSTYSGYYWYKL